jgi:hypothetical protein
MTTPQSSACATFPAGFVPFTSTFEVVGPNAAGDFLVTGSTNAANLAAISNLPLPVAANQQYCGFVNLAPDWGYAATAYVPTAAERGGNFSAFAGLLIDPLSSQPFPGGIIPVIRQSSFFAWRIYAWVPNLETSPSSLTFSSQVRGVVPPSQAISISSAASGAALSYTVAASTASGGTWISVSPQSGSTPGSTMVSVNPAGLATGNYSGTVLISTTNGSPPVTIPVR